VNDVLVTPRDDNPKETNEGGQRLTGYVGYTEVSLKHVLGCRPNAQTVALGTIITDRPRHRTVRAALPHTVSTSEGWRALRLLAHRLILGKLKPRTVPGWCWVERFPRQQSGLWG
jgi:hypothetical protein